MLVEVERLTCCDCIIPGVILDYVIARVLAQVNQRRPRFPESLDGANEEYSAKNEDHSHGT